MKRFNFISCLVFCLFIWSCVDPIEISDLGVSDDEFVLIDGSIHDGTAPYYVTVSRTISLQDSSLPISDAEVIIEEENGMTEHLQLVSPGRYQTNNIIGVAGSKYRLTVRLSNGITYQSPWEEIEFSADIQDVTYETSSILDETSIEEEIGLQFYLSSQAQATNASRYYRYATEESWEYRACRRSLFEFRPNNEPYPRNPAITFCYHNLEVPKLHLTSTVNLATNQIERLELDFIPANNQRFSFRYSYLVRQFALDANEYRLWELIEQNLNGSDVIQNRQPSSIPSNMVNTENNKDFALGYFSTPGYRDKRIFIERVDLPEGYVQSPCDENCEEEIPILVSDYETIEEYNAVVLDYIENQDKLLWFYMTGGGGLFLAPTACIDCRLQGGSITKPDFWNE